MPGVDSIDNLTPTQRKWLKEIFKNRFMGLRLEGMTRRLIARDLVRLGLVTCLHDGGTGSYHYGIYTTTQNGFDLVMK